MDNINIYVMKISNHTIHPGILTTVNNELKCLHILNCMSVSSNTATDVLKPIFPRFPL